MKDQAKTKQALIQELTSLRERITELEQSESKRKQAGDELCAVEKRLQKVYEHSFDVIYTLDCDFRVTSISNSVERYLGYRAEDLVGRSFMDLNVVAPESLEAAVKDAIRALAGDTVPTSEYVFIRKDGSRATGEVSGSPLLEDGKIIGLISVARDITERKQTERELSESEKHYRMLFNAIDEGFCIVEVIFDENEKPIDYRFLEINPSFERQTGLIGAQGKRMRELAPKHEEHWFEIYGKIALTGQPARFVNRAEQLHRWYDVYAFRVGQPEDRQVAILFNDITERKRAEEILRESEARLAKGEHVAHLGYWDLDVTNQKLAWSKEVYRLFAKDPDTFVPTFETFLATIHPEDRGRLLYIRDEAIAEGGDFTVDYRIILPDGSFRFMRETVEMTKNEAGNLTRIFGTVQDITERKRVEDALREAEERYRSIFENATEGIYQVSTEGRFITANLAAARILGYESPEELISTITDIGSQIYAYPEDRSKALVLLQKDGFIENYEVRCRHKDGSIVWVSFNAHLVRDDQGRILYHEGTSRDITERKRASEALRKSEVTLRALINAPTDVTMLLDSRGVLLDINEKAAARFGKSREELIGTLADKSLPEDVAKRRREVISQIFETGSVVRFEDSRDGTWFDTVAYPIKEQDGTFNRIAIIARDITDRKRTEEALLASQQIIEGIINAIPVRVFWKDKNLVFLGCNEAFARDAGFVDPKDIIGKDDYQMVWRDQAELYRGDDLQVIESGSSKLFIEEPQETPEGNIITLLTSKVPLRNSKGEISGVLGTYMDITDRKRAEEELQYAHDQLRALATRLEEAREETRTTISHDLHDDVGGNLAGLKMDLMRLERLVSTVSDVEQRDALMEVSLRSKELINRTIQSARRIMMELRPSVLDDFGLVAALEWQAGEFKTHTGISFQFIAEQEAVDLEKDAATAVFRIFQETLANVARHSGAGEVIVRLSSDKEMLVLEVTDNGRGITEEQLSGKESMGLMGLRERALALGGSIHVRGESGKGTTVTLRVPMGREG